MSLNWIFLVYFVIFLFFEQIMYFSKIPFLANKNFKFSIEIEISLFLSFLREFNFYYNYSISLFNNLSSYS